MKNILRKLVLFYTGFSTYITIEVLFHSKLTLFGAGWSFIASGIMGALAFILIDDINNHISWDIQLPIQMVLGGLIITLIEFIMGCISLYGFNVRMWDYINLPFNVLGIICLYFSIAWIFLSLIAIVLADVINYYVFKEGPLPYYYIFNKKISFPK